MKWKQMEKKNQRQMKPMMDFKDFRFCVFGFSSFYFIYFKELFTSSILYDSKYIA